MSNYLIFTLFYILIAGCIIYPPTEFISAGLTIESIFNFWLGSENVQFIQYHIKRSVLTLFIHSILPLSYVIGILLCTEDGIFTLFDIHWFYQILCYITLMFPIIAVYHITNWAEYDWRTHPISENLKKFSNTSNWSVTAASINMEFRRVDKICIQVNSISKLVATDNWVLKITPYTTHIAHQSDTSIIVCSSDRHDISLQSHREVQFIDIKIQSHRPSVKPFFVRLNALDFKDFEQRISRPIVVLPTVKFHKTLMERFIDVFKEQVRQNPVHRTAVELEQCIGCMQAISNVKLQKNCDELSGGENCSSCHCRPMWCVECMAKWFASRQNEAESDTWLASKCTCPVCRAKFCVLDVSFIENNDGTSS